MDKNLLEILDKFIYKLQSLKTKPQYLRLNSVILFRRKRSDPQKGKENQQDFFLATYNLFLINSLFIPFLFNIFACSLSMNTSFY